MTKIRNASADQGPLKEKKSRKGVWLGIGAASVIGVFAGGIFLGMAMVDPSESDEFKTLSNTNVDLMADLDQVKDDFSALEDGISDRETEVKKRSEELDRRSSELDKRDQELALLDEEIVEREKAVGQIEIEQAENSISNGIWTVGDDIKAGTYRTKEAVGSNCYWAVLVTGTNGGDIVNNGIPGGGRPTVTLKNGQDFESARCGTWIKQ